MTQHDRRSTRGSLTVEAALIVPLIIVALFWLVNIAFILYQHAVLQSLANQAVEAAQAGWQNTSNDISSGRLRQSADLGDEWLYWPISDPHQNVKSDSLERWVTQKLQQDQLMALFMGQGAKNAVEVTVQSKRAMGLRRSITVTITDRRKNLFSPVRPLFGFLAARPVTATSSGTIQDPAELIRNLDWGAEAYSDYINSNPDGGLAELTRKVVALREKCINLIK